MCSLQVCNRNDVRSVLAHDVRVSQDTLWLLAQDKVIVLEPMKSIKLLHTIRRPLRLANATVCRQTLHWLDIPALQVQHKDSGSPLSSVQLPPVLLHATPCTSLYSILHKLPQFGRFRSFSPRKGQSCTSNQPAEGECLNFPVQICAGEHRQQRCTAIRGICASAKMHNLFWLLHLELQGYRHRHMRRDQPRLSAKLTYGRWVHINSS